MCFLDDQPKPPLITPNTELIKRKKHRQMDRLRRTLSFRSRKKGNTANNDNDHSGVLTAQTKNGNNTPTTATSTTTAENKPPQWQDDEKSVRAGACSFNVKVIEKIINMFK